MVEKEIRLKFDFIPPSINEVYSWYYKRHKSTSYREFLSKLDVFFLQHNKKYKITEDQWLEVDYTFYFPLYFKNGKIRKKDLGNFEKVLTDGLCKFINGFKDENIKNIYLHKNNCVAGKECTIVKIRECI